MTAVKTKNRISKVHTENFRGQLLGWYDAHARVLPWRARHGETPNPYHVWLSEVMLQQTTVGAVKAYFEKFLTLWPSVHDLAAAKQEDVMNAWAGLGYYARARNLHACAKIVSQTLGGKFPNTQDELRKLPGIGEYTSAAIAAIAFNKPATVVDGNVERVMARLHAVHDPLPGIKMHLKTLAGQYFNGFTERPGDLAQAFMDLGATICIPKAPRCTSCPVSGFCDGRKQGIAADLPRKEKKTAKPQKQGHVYWIENTKGEILLHRRPQKGLLGGMLGLPTTAWEEGAAKPVSGLKSLNTFNGQYILHSFTHFDLRLDLKTARIAKAPPEHFWTPRASINKNEFPTVFKKALRLFLS